MANETNESIAEVLANISNVFIDNEEHLYGMTAVMALEIKNVVEKYLDGRSVQMQNLYDSKLHTK